MTRWREQSGHDPYPVICPNLPIFLAIYPPLEPKLAKELKRVAECILNDDCP